MLSANEKRPLNALANESSAPGARSCTICAIPRPSSIASVASLISSRFATGLSRPQGLPARGCRRRRCPGRRSSRRRLRRRRSRTGSRPRCRSRRPRRSRAPNPPRCGARLPTCATPQFTNVPANAALPAAFAPAPGGLRTDRLGDRPDGGERGDAREAERHHEAGHDPVAIRDVRGSHAGRTELAERGVGRVRDPDVHHQRSRVGPDERPGAGARQVDAVRLGVGRRARQRVTRQRVEARRELALLRGRKVGEARVRAGGVRGRGERQREQRRQEDEERRSTAPRSHCVHREPPEVRRHDIATLLLRGGRVNVAGRRASATQHEPNGHTSRSGGTRRENGTERSPPAIRARTEPVRRGRDEACR